MSSKYCDNCGHEKSIHTKKLKCKVEGCNCEYFYNENQIKKK